MGGEKGPRLNSEIRGGHISTPLCRLGNTALRSGRSLNIDPRNGRILGDQAAQQYWSRTYEKGWEMKL